MLPIKVETENWQSHRRISAVRLRELVHRIGGAGDRFLIVEGIPARPGVFVQVWHEQGGDYEFQHRTGSGVRHMFSTRLTDPDRVADAMARWAGRDEAWDAGIDWEVDDLGPAAEAEPLEPRVRERAEEHVRRMLRHGYLGLAKLADETVYLMDDPGAEPGPVSKPQAQEIVERLWLERLDEQDGWAGETDPDRLERAFAELTASGITAREDFTCCHGCGTTEIGAERTDGERGFVFFHHQGTESAAEGHGLALYYGEFEESGTTTATEVGHEVVAALTRAGLTAEWDGSPERAIELNALDWRKRLTG
ncbi:DUF6891 domain-containing protein [Streptomyces sp. NPDC059009]|uniref:DUF6891 domain-containing protein n=1 Tax=Streptomyces sp. NPDC059009 TaxID=3346694 RepID=UPI0036B949D3